jgi:hypothetical protein
MLEALAEQTIAGKRCLGIEDRAEIEVGKDAALTQQHRALFEHRRLGGVAADRRDQRELLERLRKRDP